ncbi:hypothetical protein [Synechococcus sp. PCC 7336]|uniref:hypothetical protein n=1 Tax=Synechococcus sp. PCC 7336 TaxID=195250 RepID=UPI00034CAA68|nr:hypothetical protein [Synechococcus sp. PCC 7336]
MKNRSRLAVASRNSSARISQEKLVVPLAFWLLGEIKSVGRAYQSGLGKHLNPLIERWFPKPSQMFGGPGRFGGWFLITIALYWGLHLGEPAFALFLSSTQDYVNGLEFFDGSEPLVNIFFGILRAIIVIVLGYFVVRIGLAVNRDEDWQMFVRYSVFIMGAIAIADFLAEFIVV